MRPQVHWISFFLPFFFFFPPSSGSATATAMPLPHLHFLSILFYPKIKKKFRKLKRERMFGKTKKSLEIFLVTENVAYTNFGIFIFNKFSTREEKKNNFFRFLIK